MSEKEKDYMRLYEEEKSRREKIEKDYMTLKEKTDKVNAKVAPDIIPGIISGIITLVSVLKSFAPKS